MRCAARGNPLSSWAKSDSFYGENGEFVIGEIDLSLAHRLAVSGSDHRKIPPSGVCVGGYYGAIYWWKEFDTYKGGAQRQILLQPCTAYIRRTFPATISAPIT